MSAHTVRENWNEQFQTRSDDGVANDLAWVMVAVRGKCGPPYRVQHHEWMAAKTSILREARRRGLDLSEVKL